MSYVCPQYLYPRFQSMSSSQSLRSLSVRKIYRRALLWVKLHAFHSRHATTLYMCGARIMEQLSAAFTVFSTSGTLVELCSLVTFKCWSTAEASTQFIVYCLVCVTCSMQSQAVGTLCFSILGYADLHSCADSSQYGSTGLCDFVYNHRADTANNV